MSKNNATSEGKSKHTRETIEVEVNIKSFQIRERVVRFSIS